MKWLPAAAFVLAFLTAAGALSMVVFETRADAAKHVGDFKAHEIAYQIERQHSDQAIHGIQEKLGKLHKDVIILMKSRGLKPLNDGDDNE